MAMRQLDDMYLKVVDALGESLHGQAEAVLKGDCGLDKAPHFEVKKHAFEDIRKGFLRQKLEGEYQKLFDSKALDVLSTTAIVIQNDILAGIEKAYHARHRGRLDHFVSGTSRAHGQSGPNGYVKYAMKTIPLLGEPLA